MILSSPFSQALRFEVKRSAGVAALVVIPLILIAIPVLIYTPVSWFLRLLPLLLLMGIGAYYLKRHYWQTSRRSVLEINHDEDGQWSVRCIDHWYPVELLPNCFLSPWLVVMNFKGDSGRYTVVLPADSLDHESHRRLRVRVRMTQMTRKEHHQRQNG